MYSLSPIYPLGYNKNYSLGFYIKEYTQHFLFDIMHLNIWYILFAELKILKNICLKLF